MLVIGNISYATKVAGLQKPIKVTVFREHLESTDSSHVLRLQLVPKPWSGDGVLGCTFGSVQKTK